MLRTVVFSPEDLAIVKGDPAERRRFLDELLAARWPRLAGRPRRLRPGAQAAQHPAQVAERPVPRRTAAAEAASTLDVWDAHLAAAGGELLAARLRTLPTLGPARRKAYADIAPTNSDAAAEYKTVDLQLDRPDRAGRAGRGRWSPAMAERRARRSSAASRLVGPHRDDVAARPRAAARQGVRQPRRVLVARAGPAAGQLPSAARRRRRAGAGAGRRVRRARHHPAGTAGRQASAPPSRCWSPPPSAPTCPSELHGRRFRSRTGR